MGKASGAKTSAGGIQDNRADFEGLCIFARLLPGLEQMTSMFKAEREHEVQVPKSWWGGTAPKPATIPERAKDSLSDRFF